jgi:phosphonate transport system substrate-binding protein
MNLLRANLLALGLIIIVACSGSSDTNEQTQPQAASVIRVTGIPDENPTELQRKNAPLVDYLSRELGASVEYVPVTDYGAAVQALSAGQIDFAWLGGFTHVQARSLNQAVPLTMRDIDRDFKSVFIAHIDSGIEKVEDIKGKTMAFGSKSSTSGHLMPRHFLLSQFQIDSSKDFAGEPVFSGAHDATAKIVESGKVSAGALNKQVWDRMVAEKKVDTTKVKLIWTTPGYVDYVWTARQGVTTELRDKFKHAFLKLDANQKKHLAVLELQGATKFVPASPSDFDAIEAVAKSTGLLK